MSGRITLNLDRGTDFRLDVSFEIPDKGITVLFGPSGCGKTTVLRCTAGLERAGGRVVVADRVWQDDARNIFVPAWERRLGYVFQEASLFEHLNVEGNLHFGLRHKDARGGLARFSEAVELLGIGHLLRRRVQLLSGGERQRVAIARALLMTPDLILMDEPARGARLEPQAGDPAVARASSRRALRSHALRYSLGRRNGPPCGSGDLL